MTRGSCGRCSRARARADGRPATLRWRQGTAPTPVELLVAAVASCAAHYAGRYLDRHGESREGLSVRAGSAWPTTGRPESQPSR
ncbi:OsmC family protein [Streptomyces iakyrus]|uniref:OsmC family protein n=1 Tax=Streptomyces iakyrus TaxID=68219 RepID=UPI0036A4DEC8